MPSLSFLLSLLPHSLIVVVVVFVLSSSQQVFALFRKASSACASVSLTVGLSEENFILSEIWRGTAFMTCVGNDDAFGWSLT
ncbi:hypothetical protein V5799_012789 [Amblyomma americanum]|uniref:Uncharacterized protein n=1 Tax=Amblyomma americanum TaxID=6943 RepID=A0AAQ4E7Q1_AMBAM